ncbi:MAG: hypothetical protein WEB00_03995 [Dehalococcoidia bacterium]
MTTVDWAKRGELFEMWEKADSRLMRVVLAEPFDDSSLERIYQEERTAMTRLAEFDRRMGLRPRQNVDAAAAVA